MTEAEVRQFAARYAGAWCSQNAASVAAFFHPKASLKITTARQVSAAPPSPPQRRNS